MQPTADSFDFQARAREKQASREQDERDLRSGRKSAEQLLQENALLAAFAGTAQVDVAASRSLGEVSRIGAKPPLAQAGRS